MPTEIYGCSDDLVEFDGDVNGEVGFYGSDEEDADGLLVICSDGTLLTVKYGKAKMAIWGITVVKRGELFDRIEECSDPDAKRYSDTAHFHDGLKWAYAADKWEKVH